MDVQNQTQVQIQPCCTPPRALGQYGRQHAMSLGSATAAAGSTSAVARRLFESSEMRTPRPPPFPMISRAPLTNTNAPPPPFPRLPVQPLRFEEQFAVDLARLRVSIRNSKATRNLDELDISSLLARRGAARRPHFVSNRERITIEPMDPVVNSEELDDEDRVPSRLPGDERVATFSRRYVLDRDSLGNPINTVEQPERIIFRRALNQSRNEENFDFDEKDVRYETYVPANQNVVGRGLTRVFVEEMEPLDLNEGVELNPLFHPPCSRYPQTQQHNSSQASAFSGPSVLTQQSLQFQQ